MVRPTLYIFAISHFCEKARWALDYLEVDYELAFLAPGEHSGWAKKRGLEGTTMPVLETAEGFVQGSGNIIDWAELNTQSGKTLTPEAHREDCLAMEKRLDEFAGVHTRRMFYSASLLSDPARIRENFSRDLSAARALKLKLMWPIVRRVMIKRMDIGVEQGKESQAIVSKELQWLESMYEDGRRYLLADTFTRVDLTAASLFSRLTAAPEHPFSAFMSLPPGLQDYVSTWRERPVIQRFRENYRDYRLAGTGK